MDGDTQGARVRALFENASHEIAVIAPFIKVNALRSLLEVIPEALQLRCVSRWLPKEIAAGVSDPEILDLLEARGNFSLSLVDRLHAKLYIAGNRCLAGSANVTLAGLGEVGGGSNIEVLVETTIDDPGISATLAEIAQCERPATRSMAVTARRLADSLAGSMASTVGPEATWFPNSRRPEQAYRFYVQLPSGFIGAADQVLIADLASSDLPPGLEENEFRDGIRSLLAAIPLAKTFLESTEDTMLTRADASSWLDTIAGEEFSGSDLWIAFVNWMACFFPDQVMKQEIAETALRRARLLG
ncbi:MAG: phospholipase D family protein [Gammaproteobacteria bacterium]|nr:phospholipase D family protein [Gammaproteobacteria bacterium]